MLHGTNTAPQNEWKILYAVGRQKDTEVVKLYHIQKFTKDQDDSFPESLSLKYLCSVLRSSCIFAKAFSSDEVFVSQLPKWTVYSVSLIRMPLLIVFDVS